jgi:hypothetical protein
MQNPQDFGKLFRGMLAVLEMGTINVVRRMQVQEALVSYVMPNSVPARGENICRSSGGFGRMLSYGLVAPILVVGIEVAESGRT